MRNRAMSLVRFLASLIVTGGVGAAPPAQVLDLSLVVSPELPCVWPVGMLRHAVLPAAVHGPGPYRRDLIIIDEHTGTQWDAPAHFVPPPGSGLPGEGPMGLVTCEKVPAWQLCGEACVIDVSDHVDDAPRGRSYLIEPAAVQAWEKSHRAVGPGDVVLFRSGYADRYYKPLPAGERFVHLPLRGESPAWPAPSPATMTYLGEKGVMALGIDSPSMGPLPDLAAATHQAGGRLGMVWTECAAGLGQLPPAGAFYAMLAPKHAGGSGGECRAVAVTQRELAHRLIESARRRRVADLSVTLDEDYPVSWPGRAAGEEAGRYLAKTLNAFHPARGPYFARAHVLDALAGTHVKLPSFSLPPPGFDPARYGDETRAMLARYEVRFGPRGFSDLTAERARLGDMAGEAHVIDVRALVGSTRPEDWPASPRITLDLVRRHEEERPILPGEVVILHSGYVDAHFRPLPAAPNLDRLFAAPLAGKAEGWPAPAPEVIAYLAGKGVRCVATDAPTLGGVEQEAALFVDWLAATRGIVVVEFLQGVAAIRGERAFFLFAPVRIAGACSAHGRAVAMY